MTGVFQPAYSPWRHGGWYIDNIRYPTGAVGCVSRNYPDKKWRIVCDERPDAHELYTYPSRDAAAIAEHEIAVAECAQRIIDLAGQLYPVGPCANPEKPKPNGQRANCAACGCHVPEGAGIEVFCSGMTRLAFLHSGCADKVAAAQNSRHQRGRR